MKLRSILYLILIAALVFLVSCKVSEPPAASGTGYETTKEVTPVQSFTGETADTSIIETPSELSTDISTPSTPTSDGTLRLSIYDSGYPLGDFPQVTDDQDVIGKFVAMFDDCTVVDPALDDPMIEDCSTLPWCYLVIEDTKTGKQRSAWLCTDGYISDYDGFACFITSEDVKRIEGFDKDVFNELMNTADYRLPWAGK